MKTDLKSFCHFFITLQDKDNSATKLKAVKTKQALKLTRVCSEIGTPKESANQQRLWHSRILLLAFVAGGSNLSSSSVSSRLEVVTVRVCQ